MLKFLTVSRYELYIDPVKHYPGTNGMLAGKIK